MSTTSRSSRIDTTAVAVADEQQLAMRNVSVKNSWTCAGVRANFLLLTRYQVQQYMVLIRQRIRIKKAYRLHHFYFTIDASRRPVALFSLSNLLQQPVCLNPIAKN